MAKVRLSKKAVAAIVSIACAAVLICALLIVNVFYPLRYFTAFIAPREEYPEGELNMCVLDVGQADCAIVTLPNGKTLLIDGGDGTYRNNLKILTELNRRCSRRIDYIVCTSVKDEHCGGLGEIIRNSSVGAIFYPYCTNRYITESFGDFISAANGSGARMIVAEYGAGVSSEDFYFTFLSPSVHTNPDSEYAQLNSDPNDGTIAAASAVLWIEHKGTGIVYAGDVTGAKLDEIAATYNLMQQLGDPDGYFTFSGHVINFSSCAAYKAAAHAAESSLSTSFTDLISPDISVISVGENNSEGCPSVSVLADLLAHGTTDDNIFMTCYDGDVTLNIDGSGRLTASAAD